MVNDEELDIEDDEPLDDVSEDEYDDDEDVDESDEEDIESNVEPRARTNTPEARKIAALQAEVADLNRRLGNAVRVGGQKLKGFEDDVYVWTEKLNEWTNLQVERVRALAYEEGRKSVESELLDKVTTLDKANYLEAARAKTVPVSQEKLPQIVAPPRRSIVSDNSVNTEPTKDSSIGIDLTDEDKLTEIVKKVLQSTQRDSRRESGSTKVGTQTSSQTSSIRAVTPRNSRLQALRIERDEIDKKLEGFKQRSRADLAAPLLRRRKEVIADIERIMARNS